jgi:hypothetical protein
MIPPISAKGTLANTNRESLCYQKYNKQEERFLIT